MQNNSHLEVAVPVSTPPSGGGPRPGECSQTLQQLQLQTTSTQPMAPKTFFFLNASFLRDILALEFILLALPNRVSLIVLIAHVILGCGGFSGYKYLAHCILFNDFRWRGKVSFVELAKIATLDTVVFTALSLCVRHRSHFNYVVILLKTLISWDVIGASSSAALSAHQTLPSIHNKPFNAFACFVLVNYIRYIMHWFSAAGSLSYGVLHETPYISRFNFQNRLFLFLCVHVIVSSLFFSSPVIEDVPVSHLSHVNCDESKLLRIDVGGEINRNNMLHNHTARVPRTKSADRIPRSVDSKSKPDNKSKPDTKSPKSSETRLSLKTYDVRSTKLHELKAYKQGTLQAGPVDYSPHLYGKSIALHNFENFVTKKSLLLDHVLMQPFWAVLSAGAALLRKPSLFVGQSTKCKNTGGTFTHASVAAAPMKMSVACVDGTRVVFEMLDAPLRTGVLVRLNSIDWNMYKIIDNKYLLVYGLTPLFQYEIVVVSSDNQVCLHYIVNTTSTEEDTSKKTVLNESIPETSSLKTLQISLLSQIESLAALRARNKKFKKDEHKKVMELTKSIDALKAKISKYNGDVASTAADAVVASGGDQRAMGKLKGLKHTVNQLEHEIEALHTLVSEQKIEKERVAEELVSVEHDKKAEIARLEAELSAYESRLENDRLRLKAATSELATVRLKNSKLKSKRQARFNEVEMLDSSLESMRKDITVKVNRRIRKLNDNFNMILPEVTKETELLEKSRYV